MKLDFYKRVLKRMVDNQEELIQDSELSDTDLAIEIGILEGVKICLEKAEQIVTI